MPQGRKLAQISVDGMAWLRLKAMRPPEMTSMTAWAAHILEEYSMRGDDASKLLMKGFVTGEQFAELEKRISEIEALLTPLPVDTGAAVEKQVEEEIHDFSDIDIDSLSLAELRMYGTQWDLDNRDRDSLLQELKSLQESLLILEEE